MEGNKALESRALRPDGTRVKMHPLESKGTFSNIQRVWYPLLIAFYAALPLIPVGGHPAVLLDVAQRQFYLFGFTFNASDTYLAFFLLSGVAFTLVVLSTLAGRIWCGWACPQTVFLEGLYRRIEALVEGPARRRAAAQGTPWTRQRVLQLLTKHALFVLVTLLVTHVFLGWFVGLDNLATMLSHSPADNPGPFAFVMVLSGILYFNFAWFREQFCIVLCPYGRLQSVLADQETLQVGYDATRGEPRGKMGSVSGACVDCSKCVQVCPTGIDIRNGMQMECIGCAHCIDACNEVMVKIGRPQGLIRYDSLGGLEGKPKRFLRPRVYGYLVAGIAGVIAMTLAASLRTPFQVALLRAQNPRQVDGQVVTERFVVHVTSKSAEPTAYALHVDAPQGLSVTVPLSAVDLGPFESRYLPVLVEHPLGATLGGQKVTAEVTDALGRKRTAALPL